MSDAGEKPKCSPPAGPPHLDPERFSKLASGVQSIITALGIVVGGLWVLYTFRELGTAEQSRAALAELDLKQRIALEELAERQPSLQVNLKWETSGAVTGGKRFLSLQAKIRNDGKHALEFGDTSLQISRLLEQSGEPDPEVAPLRLRPQTLGSDGKISDMPARVLRAAQERTIVFMAPTLVPGSYLVQLQTVYNGLLLIDGQFQPTSEQPIQAVEQTIVNVPAVSKEPQSYPATMPLPHTQSH
jgi:hypothetical protein